MGNWPAKGVLGEGHLRAEADGIAEERAGRVNRDMATYWRILDAHKEEFSKGKLALVTKGS